MIDFNEYQRIAATTAIYPADRSYEYLSTGLASEAGEVCGKVAKSFRGDRELDTAAVADELGDCLWFISEFARQLGYSLNTIAEMNAEKLIDRQKRNVLKGDGDKR